MQKNKTKKRLALIFLDHTYELCQMPFFLSTPWIPFKRNCIKFLGLKIVQILHFSSIRKLSKFLFIKWRNTVVEKTILVWKNIYYCPLCMKPKDLSFKIKTWSWSETTKVVNCGPWVILLATLSWSQEDCTIRQGRKKGGGKGEKKGGADPSTPPLQEHYILWQFVPTWKVRIKILCLYLKLWYSAINFLDTPLLIRFPTLSHNCTLY